MTAPKGWSTRRLPSGATLYRAEASTTRLAEAEEIAQGAEALGMTSGALMLSAALAFVRGREPVVSVPLSGVSREALEEEIARRAPAQVVMDDGAPLRGEEDGA